MVLNKLVNKVTEYDQSIVKKIALKIVFGMLKKIVKNMVLNATTHHLQRLESTLTGDWYILGRG